MVTSARCVGFTARVHFSLTPSPFSVAGVLPAPRAWLLLPLSSSYSHGWSATGVQSATCLLATSLGHCGRPTWRSRACPVWVGCGDPASLYLAGQVLASHFPQVEATTMKAISPSPPQLVQNSDGEGLLFTPQIPVTERDQTDTQEFFLSSKLLSSSSCHPPLNLMSRDLPLLTHGWLSKAKNS